MDPENDERGYITASMLKKYLGYPESFVLYGRIGGIHRRHGEYPGWIRVTKEQCKKDPFTGLRKPATK